MSAKPVYLKAGPVRDNNEQQRRGVYSLVYAYLAANRTIWHIASANHINRCSDDHS